MRFGLLYSLQSRPDKTTTQAQIYREMLEQVAVGEEMGYDSAWLVEHHFLADGICPSPLVTAAAMAARTRRMTIGTSMYLLPLHRPVQSAEDVAVLDNISNGRVVLGVAAGYRPEEFAGHEEERSGRERRMEEQLEIMIKAWTTDSFSYDGRYYKIPETMVTPKPVQKPRPPVWIGASTRAGCRRAAQWADALVASPRHHLNELKQHQAMYGEYLQRFNKSPACIPVIREVYCAPTIAQAEAEARDGVMYIHGGMYGKWSGVRPLRDDQGQLVKDPAAVTFESHRDRFIIGSPDHCTREIQRYQRELGMDYLICWTNLPGIDASKTLASMRLFASEVMPHFRD
jgi:alkanesulfonate monooxygenase SsuD/methylene tetrahydromethanopterin reductase-like flavin-dependent oxidoreductase (luciferase family)